jgi:hypothetical protein
MENKDIYEDISSIKNIMERSTRFISLSGLSGVMAGIYALAGAVAVYFLPNNPEFFIDRNPPVKGLFYGSDVSFDKYFFINNFNTAFKDARLIMLIGLMVLLLSIGTGILLTRRKARAKGLRIWSESSRALLKSAIVPLITGAFFILIVLWKGDIVSIFPLSLIFYGIALSVASRYTYGDVKWLGLLEIVLGLIGTMYMHYGLLFWAIGFGVLHILYGTIMYFKYDRGNNAA